MIHPSASSSQDKDGERASWRTVIFYNVIRSVKHVLVALADMNDIDDGSDANSIADFNEFDDSQSIASVVDISNRGHNGIHTGFHPQPGSIMAGGTTVTSSETRSPSVSSYHRPSSSSTGQIASLRLRLSPLQTMVEPLAQRLGGGMPLADTKGQMYVRSGWQTRPSDSANVPSSPDNRKGRSRKAADAENFPPSLMEGTVVDDPLLENVAMMLERSKADIKSLWENPMVVALVARRKLKLDEWSELYVLGISHWLSHLLLAFPVAFSTISRVLLPPAIFLRLVS